MIIQAQCTTIRRILNWFFSPKFWGGLGWRCSATETYSSSLPSLPPFPNSLAPSILGFVVNSLLERYQWAHAVAWDYVSQRPSGQVVGSFVTVTSGVLWCLGPIGRRRSPGPGSLIGAFDWRAWVQIFNGTPWIPRRFLRVLRRCSWVQVSQGGKRGAAGARECLLLIFERLEVASKFPAGPRF